MARDRGNQRLQNMRADPARAVLEPIGGNGSQKVTTEFAGEIARGDVDVALFVGLLASAVAYVLMARSLDLAAETAKAEADSREHGVEAVTFAGRVAPVES